MCKCLSVLGRIIIGILSVLFAILGFVFLVLGVMVKVQADAINQLFQPLLEMAKSQAKSATGGSLDLPTDNFNIGELVGGLAIAFIVLGIFMLFIGVFGVAGACCQVKCMLIVYIVIVGVLLISQIILVIIVAVNRSILTDPAKPEILASLHAEFTGVNGTDGLTLAWNAAMNGGCWNTLWDFIFTGTPFIIFACADIGGFALLTFFSITILYDVIQKAKVGTIA